MGLECEQMYVGGARGLMMRKRHSDVKYVLCITPIIFALSFLHLAWAATAEIYAITPDIGNNNASTQVTIYGTGFLRQGLNMLKTNGIGTRHLSGLKKLSIMKQAV